MTKIEHGPRDMPENEKGVHQIEVTPEMMEAGGSVIQELMGVVSYERLAFEGYTAMAQSGPMDEADKGGLLDGTLASGSGAEFSSKPSAPRTSSSSDLAPALSCTLTNPGAAILQAASPYTAKP